MIVLNIFLYFDSSVFEKKTRKKIGQYPLSFKKNMYTVC